MATALVEVRSAYPRFSVSVVDKAAKDYEAWLASNTSKPPGEMGPARKQRLDAARRAYIAAGGDPQDIADSRRNQVRRTRQQGQEHRARVRREKGLDTGLVDSSSAARKRVLRWTEKSRSRTAKRLMAGAAGAVPGAMAGMMMGGPVGAALGGALTASAAYPAASYAGNATTMRRDPQTGLPASPYRREKGSAHVWEQHRRQVRREHPEVRGDKKAEIQQANRTMPEELPGAARRRLGAMAYGARPVGRYAAPVAVGGAAAGVAAHAARQAVARRAAARAAAAERSRRAQRARRLRRVGAVSAVGAGAAGLGAAAGSRHDRER